MVAALERQIGRHQRAKRGEGMMESAGNQRVRGEAVRDSAGKGEYGRIQLLFTASF